MVAISLLSCNSYLSALKIPPPPPPPPPTPTSSPAPPSNSLVSRRHLFFRPVTASAPSSRLERAPVLTVEMQSSSSSNKSASEPIAEEDDEKISTGGNTLASTPENTGFLGQLSAIVNMPIWAKFVLGSVFLLAIPILRKSRRIKDVTKTVEEVAELVEKAAEVTEKMAGEIAEALPEGRMKEAALKLEKIALLVDKEAEFTESIIDKVDDLVEVMDTNRKLVEGEIEKNDEEDQITLKKIVVDQSKETMQ